MTAETTPGEATGEDDGGPRPAPAFAEQPESERLEEERLEAERLEAKRLEYEPLEYERREDERPEESDGAYFESYADPGVHRLMIGDHERTDAYRRALEARVEPGMRVLDVGTGSGILALFAARAGAKVVAVDDSPIVELAQRLAEANGLARSIEFRRGRAEDLILDRPVDLLVSEWMGFFALAECMFRSVVAARDRHLAPGGAMLPERLELWIAPVEDSDLHVDLGIGLWERPVYGFDFGEMLEHELSNLLSTAVDLRPSALLGPEGCVLDLDLATAAADDFFFETTVDLTIERDGRLHGFGGWFVVDLAAGVRLSTGPHAPETHWRQSFFPVRPFSVVAGDVLELCMRAIPRESGDRRLPIYFLETALFRGGEELHRCFYRHEASFE